MKWISVPPVRLEKNFAVLLFYNKMEKIDLKLGNCLNQPLMVIIYVVVSRSKVAVNVCVQYLIKVNEIKTKKGADLLQHLVDYYQAQHKYAVQTVMLFHT